MTLRIGVCTPIARAAFERELQRCEGVAVEWLALADLPAAAGRCDALVLSGTDYSPALASALAQPGCPCRWLQLLSAGYELLSVHGVPAQVEVSNAGPVWSPTVAEHAMALMLAMVRRLPKVLAAQAGAHWDGSIRHDMQVLFGGHLVIVGMGSIGRELARRARAFGMRVTGVSRSSRPQADADAVLPVARLHEALAQADVIVSAVPGSPAAEKLIDARALAACQPHALLVNVGRGNVVDTDALVQALRSGTIAGAALDVTEPEPLPDGHPLWSLPNAIVSPHLGGASPERYYERLALHVAANVRVRAAGQPLADRVQVQAQEPA